MSSDEIARFLAEPRTAALSTLDHSGAPHAAGMWFAIGGPEILMWTYAKSQKAVNLRRDPRCALLVEDGVAYGELRGVMVTGAVTLIETIEDIRSIGIALYERYTKPATGVAVEDGPIVEIERQARKRVGISLPLAHAASWDHRKLGM